MRPPPIPHASPLPSFCTRPEGAFPITRRVSFAEALGQVVGWPRGRQPDWRQRVREAKWVDLLAEEFPEPTEPEVKADGLLQSVVKR